MEVYLDNSATTRCYTEVQREIFEEKYYPIKKEMILSKLKMMGYTNISVYCFPSYFKMPEFELVDWYCIMAKKND